MDINTLLSYEEWINHTIHMVWTPPPPPPSTPAPNATVELVQSEDVCGLPPCNLHNLIVTEAMDHIPDTKTLQSRITMKLPIIISC